MNDSPQKPKILIVDDKPQNLYALAKLLEQLEVAVVRANSGMEALQLSLNHDFCLAIVDVQMPEMDGYELVELLRSNDRTKTLPVIFVSAIFSDEFHHRKGYEAGAVDFMSKPFNPEILLSKVRVFLDLYHQRVKLERMVKLLDQANQKFQKANIVLSKRSIQLDASNQVGRQVTAILDLDRLLAKVVSLIVEKFRYYLVGVWLLNQKKARLELQAGWGQAGDEVLASDYTLPLEGDKGIISLVGRSRSPYLANEVERDPHYLAVDALPDTRSELALPLQVGSQMIGVLDIQSDQVNAFDDEDQTVLQTLADQIAIAIHNARLYALEKSLRELEAQKVQELAKLNANKDKFFSIVAHDLRAPFNPLLGMAKLMVRMPDSTPPSEFREMGQSLHTSARNVFSLLENLLQWSRLQRGKLEHVPESLMLKQVVDKNIKLLADNALGKGVSLQSTVPDGMVVYADSNMLEAVIRNLISNALKFTPGGGQVTISAAPDGSASELAVVAVSDTGVGISPEDQAKLFQLGVTHTTKGTAKEEGSGLGLIICKEMVEKNGGQIWLESEIGQGTTVKFTVPLQKVRKTGLSPSPTVTVEAENNGAGASSDEELTPPPPAEMRLLHNLAKLGNLSDIKKQALRIAALDQKYEPFAFTLHRLAEGFQAKKLLALIEQYMED